jgi:hypothetical protein
MARAGFLGGSLRGPPRPAWRRVRLVFCIHNSPELFCHGPQIFFFRFFSFFFL